MPYNKHLLKARLHRRFLSRQLDAIFVALKLQKVSNMFETPAISRRQIALKTAPGLHMRFWSCNSSAIKIASSCSDKNRLCKRAFKTFFIKPLLFCYINKDPRNILICFHILMPMSILNMNFSPSDYLI